MRLLGVEGLALPLATAGIDGRHEGLPTPRVEKDFGRISKVAYAEEDAFRRHARVRYRNP